VVAEAEAEAEAVVWVVVEAWAVAAKEDNFN
jgi:hypothetical protein